MIFVLKQAIFSVCTESLNHAYKNKKSSVFQGEMGCIFEIYVFFYLTDITSISKFETLHILNKSVINQNTLGNHVKNYYRK